MKFENIISSVNKTFEELAIGELLLSEPEQCEPMAIKIRIEEIAETANNQSIISYYEDEEYKVSLVKKPSFDDMEHFCKRTVFITGVRNTDENTLDILSIIDLSELEEEYDVCEIDNIAAETLKKYKADWKKKKVSSTMQKDLMKKLVNISTINPAVATDENESIPVVYRTLEEIDLCYDVVKHAMSAAERAEFESSRTILQKKPSSTAEKNNLMRVLSNLLIGVGETQPKLEFDVSQVMSEIRKEYFGQEAALYAIEQELFAANLTKLPPQTMNFIGTGAGTLCELLADALHKKMHFVNLSGQVFRDTDKLMGSGRIYENGQEGNLWKILKSVGPGGVLVFENIDQYDETAQKIILPLLKKDPFVDTFMLAPIDLTKYWIFATCKCVDAIPSAIRSSTKEIVLEELSDTTKTEIINQLLLPKLCEEFQLDLASDRAHISKEVADILIHELGRNSMKKLKGVVRETVISAKAGGLVSFPNLQTREQLQQLVHLEEENYLKYTYVTTLAEMENKFFRYYRLYPKPQRNRILELFDDIHRAKNDRDKDYPLQVLKTLTNLLDDEQQTEYTPGSIAREFVKDYYGLDSYAQDLEDVLLSSQMNQKNNRIITILLHGKPGTGKTSTAKAVAKALGRKYIKLSMPGKTAATIKGLLPGHQNADINGLAVAAAKECASFHQCLFLLDEIDKADSRGNVYDVLHELFDPNQKSFYDEYAKCELSKKGAFFICTANDISKLPDSLLDRVTVIEMKSYTNAEKKEIARLIAKQYEKEYCLESVSLEETALELLVKQYAIHFGVRDLQADIKKLIVRKLRENKKAVSVSSEDVQAVFGVPRNRGLIDIPKEKQESNTLPGQATALAVAGSLGSSFAIQTVVNEFQKEPLLITGLVEGSCLESIKVAVSMAERILQKPLPKLHINFTDSGIKKDGPSAGVTILCSILSCMLKKTIPSDVAFTGTIEPLYGNVSVVGGINEKLSAAEMTGIIKRVYIPRANYEELALKNELENFSLEIVPVDTVYSVLEELLDFDAKRFI